MKLSDREITSFEEIVAVLERCDTIRLGIHNEPYPYVVPVSFGYEVVDGKIVLYVHGAMAGLKNELLDRNPYVCVEADRMLGYAYYGTKTTADYESLIGFGKAEAVEEEEAVKGIELLMAHCGQPGFDGHSCIRMGITRIYKITLESVTGKCRFPGGRPEGWT